MSLYLKHRPTEWSQVIGQEAAVSKLEKKLDKGDLPNVILLFGPTGAGKTTCARILSDKLGVKTTDNPNYTERNCADCRSIDDVRDIESEMSLAGFGKHHRKVWVLDEVVQLPDLTQKSMLKMLEDTPKHVYFLLCTTDKAKLLDTLVSRCYPVQFKKIKEKDLQDLVQSIAEREDKELTARVRDEIAELADGSARMALQLLESVLTQETEAARLAALETSAAETVGFQLAQALMYRKGWPVVEKMLRGLVQEPESVRRVILKYCETVLLGNSQMNVKVIAASMIGHFQYSFSESGKAGLIERCWRVVFTK